MPSNRAFLDLGIVQPTKYVVPPTRVAKELPPEPWQLPKFSSLSELHIPHHGSKIPTI